MKVKIREIVVFVLLAVCSMVLVGCSGSKKEEAIAKYGSDTLKVFMPGEYISDEIIPAFEKEFGVKVIPELFDSNEMMYTKVQAGDKYDVLIPSDYMIERLLKEDMLQPLDKSMIPNMSNLAEQVLNRDYDKENTYSAPYFWGTVGIVYNHNNVPESLLENEGFDILKNPKYRGRIYMYDSERDGFMIAFKQLGYSMNTDNDAEIEAAYNWLLELNATMDPVYVTDEVIDYMMSGSKDLAIVYSGDAVTILDENEDMSYFTPECGTNVWFDSMVIPKNAENPKLANEFINYILSYDASMLNTEAVGYASPNAKVLNEMAGEGGVYEENAAYYPRTYAKDENFVDNEYLRKKLSELWIKVKASK